MEDNKMKIAAITAVLQFIRTEEETAYDDTYANSSAPTSSDNFWNYSGRQSQMMIRNMAQMRLFPGWKR